MSASAQAKSRYALFISTVAAVGGFLFGYDLVIISGAQILLEKQFHLKGFALGFATTSAILGCVAGPFLGGWMCDKFGRKNTMIISAALFTLGTIGTVVPPSHIFWHLHLNLFWRVIDQERNLGLDLFNLFRILGGIGVGLCSLASPMYIAEVAPPKMRGKLGILFQLSISVGAICSGVISWRLAKLPAETEPWRWMFASGLIPIGALPHYYRSFRRVRAGWPKKAVMMKH